MTTAGLPITSLSLTGLTTTGGIPPPPAPPPLAPGSPPSPGLSNFTEIFIYVGVSVGCGESRWGHFLLLLDVTDGLQPFVHRMGLHRSMHGAISFHRPQLPVLSGPVQLCSSDGSAPRGQRLLHPPFTSLLLHCLP